MKEYPLDEGELNELAWIGRFATLCFAGAAGLFGFVVNVSKDIALSQSAPQAVVGFWGGMRWAAAIGAVALLVGGIVAMAKGHSRVEEIKNETSHDGT